MPKGTIEIHKNSITEVSSDAIVNAANSMLRHGSGVCGYIFEAAGAEELAKECKAIGYCDVGSAVITSACGLKEKNGNRFIIHAVGPKYVDGRSGERELLYSCYQKALGLAMENGCRSVTFPLLSAGIFKYPLKGAWETALEASQDFLDTYPDYDLTIVFVGLKREILQVGKDILAGMQQKRAERGKVTDDAEDGKAGASDENSANQTADGTNPTEKADAAKPEYVFFWKEGEADGYLSNWYKAPFVIEGEEYLCVEQYMMSRKALLFRDFPVYEQILKTSGQHEMKALGKQVHNFDSAKWSACREEVVYNACMAKFTQNPELGEKLLGTAGKALAEASPKDLNWGIGLDAVTAAETDPDQWPGNNLLGKVLVRVREVLAQKQG